MTGSWWLDYFLPWLTAVSTFVGVGAAIVAGIYAARAFNRERARDEQREQEQRQAQASLVAAWQVALHSLSLELDLRASHGAVDARHHSVIRGGSGPGTPSTSGCWRRCSP